jgi:methylmalonyl-CoA epimerase
MNIVRIDHIAIAVPEGQKIVDLWKELLDFQLEGVELLKENGVAVFMVGIKNRSSEVPCIEFLEPLNQSSPINNFLTSRGSGIHHICFQTTNIVQDLAELKSKGAKLIDATPRPGAHNSLIAFVNPQSLGGILIELKQINENGGN